MFPTRELPRYSLSLVIGLLWLSPCLAQVQSNSTNRQNGTSTAITQLKTVAESSNYQSTAGAIDVSRYLETLDQGSPRARLESIGTTIEGRPIQALIVGRSDSIQLPLPKSDPRLVVILLGGIHAGECDGKEALLALARDSIVDAPASWWEKLVLVFIPNFNADGAERIGQGHRPEQNGPVSGRGIRENAQGLDLNRDFVKLETPEVRALVSALNRFDADVLIDTHTTNGSLHRYELTYDIPHNPATADGIRGWLREKMIPAATALLRSQGIESFYYGNFNAEYDRWESYGHEPRYCTEYMGLRGRIGILCESYAYASYERRIQVSYAFVKSCLDLLADNANEVQRQIAIADARLSSLNHPPVPIRSIATAWEDTYEILGYKFSDAQRSRIGGTNRKYPDSSDRNLVSKLEPAIYQVRLESKFNPTLSVKAPAAYLIPPQFARVADRLRMHGVRIEEVPAAETSMPVDVTEYEVIQSVGTDEFQNHTLRRIDVKAHSKQRVLCKGSFLVRTDQPLGTLAIYLLEPHSDDSLALWNFFDPAAQVGDFYDVARIENPIAIPKTDPTEIVSHREQLTLEALYAPERTIGYGGSRVTIPQWIKNSSEYLVSKEKNLLAVDALSGAMRPFEPTQQLADSLAKLDAFDRSTAESYRTKPEVFNDDFSLAVIDHHQDLFLYSTTTKGVKQLTHTPDIAEQLAELSPTGKQVAFVLKNSLMVIDCATLDTKPISKNDTPDLLSGILDWVYQEEIFGRDHFKAFWWSPDGQRLAWLQLDESPVDRFQVADSIPVQQSLEETRYPTSGAPLPSVKLFVTDIRTWGTREIDLSQYPVHDRLVVHVDWFPDSQRIAVQVQNRIQTWLDLVFADSTSGVSVQAFREKGTAWIDLIGSPHWLPSGDFLWLSDLPSGRRHLYHVSLDGSTRVALTQGNWDVEEFLSVDPDGKTAWVTGNPSNPIEQHLIRVDLEKRSWTQVTKQPGTHQVSVHPKGKFFTDSFSSIKSPPIGLLCNSSGETIRIITAPVSDRHEFLDVSPPRLMTIQARDGVPLQSMLIAPPHVDLTQPNQRHPVLIFVYGGPRLPTVHNNWQTGNYWWHQYLAQQGYFVLLCDNRSARGRGMADTWPIYKDFGRVELRDLEDAVGWIKNQPWADSHRIGLWGWSYGGYLTSFAMTHSNLFKSGIAGAPVTDWRNYDAIYTERYMDLPKNNEAGYKSSSVVDAAKNLSGHILVIHGERDDNVHISNSLQFIYELQKANKSFEMMFYPKNRHGVIDPQQRYHLYRTMTDFLKEHL